MNMLKRNGYGKERDMFGALKRTMGVVGIASRRRDVGRELGSFRLYYAMGTFGILFVLSG